jgi:hypothetical protein
VTLKGLLWDRLVAQGKARDGISTETATDILFGPLVFRLMGGHAPLDEEHADAISAAALEGLLGPDR